jgi:hypothetical protein
MAITIRLFAFCELVEALERTGDNWDWDGARLAAATKSIARAWKVKV